MFDNAEMWVPFLVLLGLVFTSIPVAYALAIAGVVGLAMAVGVDGALDVIKSVPVSDTASYSLVSIPMFILMAEFLSGGRIVSGLFKMARDWFSPVRGGLAMGVVGANAVFGAMSGSSVAAAGLMGKISVPEMRRYGYSDRIALGTVASAGTLAVMIPPSVAMIIYALATDTSISLLFAGGLLPGIATAIVYIGVIFLWARVAPSAVPKVPTVTWRERFSSLRGALPGIPLLVLVLGGIYSGLMTPNEAGAIGAAGALIISMTFGGLRLPGIRAAIIGTVSATGMIVLIMVCAGIFSRYLTLSKTSLTVVEFITSIEGSRFLILLAVIAVYLVLGMFMSMTAVLIMTLPLTFPIISSLGYDPVWFGLVVVKTVEIGLATPPLGMNVFVTHAAAGGKLSHAFSGAAAFVAGDFLVLAAMLAAPDVVVTVAEWLVG
ncbi:TRAP transporter large permease [Prauserella cavernicola]|uniref:TRAP transporter large permease n=1 Tax=Prauserella cavernicola TaxID=2800127 RepID=A0A934R229_9PSEU|nr:TRAP transporter large permease [Prauserella cavernicola]MBK1789449.1 TRAP transporter large permease [Prauserella cavernicola]